MQALNLLSSMTRVEVPFIKVTIGEYTFGIYDKLKTTKGIDEYGVYKLNHIRFPNYIKSLNITKINGQVNNYTLELEYTITENDDPNFFEKVFSSVSKTRKIVFSYGDLSVPYYCYRDEEATILDVKSAFNVASSKIKYTVTAVGAGHLLSMGTYPYIPAIHEQPSTVIKNLFKNNTYGLADIFYGMKNGMSINGVELIPGDDTAKDLIAFTNITALEYLRYLVSEMTPRDSNDNLKKSLYILTINDDTTGTLQGPYIKIERVDNDSVPEAYNLDIGYISKDAVLDFNLDNNENYSIFYNYSKQLNDSEYVQRLNNRGEIEEVYAPILSSGNALYMTQESDKSWWTKVTAFPIKASVTIRGLLRPAMLMSHVNLSVYFYGRKHISSGHYIVTKQQDSISEAGFRTTLNLLRTGDS